MYYRFPYLLEAPTNFLPDFLVPASSYRFNLIKTSWQGIAQSIALQAIKNEHVHHFGSSASNIFIIYDFTGSAQPVSHNIHKPVARLESAACKTLPLTDFKWQNDFTRWLFAPLIFLICKKQLDSCRTEIFRK